MALWTNPSGTPTTERMELWCQEYHYGRGCRLTWGDLGEPGGCAAINGGSIGFLRF